MKGNVGVDMADVAFMISDPKRRGAGSSNATQLLCYGTFQLRCMLDRRAHQPKSRRYRQTGSIVPSATPEPIRQRDRSPNAWRQPDAEALVESVSAH